jgi:hypothetical protein
MTVKDFYKYICDLFNSGQPLPAKFTRKSDGYWKMTKGYQHYGGVEIPLHHFAELIIIDNEYKKLLQKKSKKKEKPYDRVHAVFSEIKSDQRRAAK